MNMKWLVSILFVLGSTALGKNADFRNLKSVFPCFDQNNVQVSTDATKAIDKSQIFTFINNKLAAYRIPITNNDLCDSMPWFIHIQIEGTKNVQGIWLYQYTLNVFDKSSGLYEGWVNIWNTGAYGFAPASTFDLLADAKDSFGEIIDEFAADYAKANP